MADTAPQAFDAAMCKQTQKNCKTPLHLAIEHKSLDIVKYICQRDPQNKPAALNIKNELGLTPIELANSSFLYSEIFLYLYSLVSTEFHVHAYKNEYQEFKGLAQQNPEAFKAALTKVDFFGRTPLHFDDGTLVNFIAKAAPTAFKEALLLKNQDGNTPIHLATLYGYCKSVKCMALEAPEVFKAGMVIQNNNGNRSAGQNNNNRSLN